MTMNMINTTDIGDQSAYHTSTDSGYLVASLRNKESKESAECHHSVPSRNFKNRTAPYHSNSRILYYSELRPFGILRFSRLKKNVGSDESTLLGMIPCEIRYLKTIVQTENHSTIYSLFSESNILQFHVVIKR